MQDRENILYILKSIFVFGKIQKKGLQSSRKPFIHTIDFFFFKLMPLRNENTYNGKSMNLIQF